MKKTIKNVLAVSILVSASAYFVVGYKAEVMVVDQSSDSRPHSLQKSSQSSGIPFQNMDDIQVFINSLSKRMTQQHGHEISNVTVQLTMADFRAFVLEQFPIQGESAFQQIMRNAFPEYADQIFALLDNMRLYNDWHVDMLLTLNDMDSITRDGTLWGKRRELFGSLAEEIWQKELDEKEAKQKNVQETLALLQVANDISMRDRLYMLTDSISQEYGDEHANILISKGMVADIYFHLDSVQNDLKSMTDSERQEALAESRRQLGFTEENIQEMAAQDAEKESRWKNGYEYMSARDQLVNLYEGDELAEKLEVLRVTYFKHEAPTIAKEEQDAFFRYNRPRLYGSN